MLYLKPIRLAVCAVLYLLGVESASATLIDNGNGLIYDDVFNITWTQDAILSATAVIEHLLVDELESNSISGNKGTLAAAIQCARKTSMFSPQLLDGADELRNLRNPLVHRNADTGEYSLAERFRKHQVHPSTLLEADARLALRLMYDFFRSVLKEGA